MIEALLSLRLPGFWVTPVTESYDVEVSCRIGGRSDEGGWGLVTMRGEREELDDALELIRGHPSVGGVSVKRRGEREISFVLDVVDCPACEALVTSKSFMVFPVEIREGRMKWLMITEDKDLGTVLERLEMLKIDFKVERITKIRGKGVLTERQEDVVKRALKSGFFDFPRRTDSEALARDLGIAVSTLSEILRAAERRIFSEYMRT